MIDVLAAGAFPFTVALSLMALIGIMEAMSVIFGISLSTAVDTVLPDVDVDVAHPGHDGALAHLFSFLAIGKVPALMLVVLFLAFFGLTGYTVQFVSTHTIGPMLPAWLAAIPATAGGILGMSRIGNRLAKLMPKDVSDVSSRNELLGATATIIRGIAKPGSPAEAKARDLRGKVHYILVEPKEGEPFLNQGDTAMVLRQGNSKSVFVATNELARKG